MSMYPKNMFFTSESVTEGHPDKFCDQISDTVLDECLRQDPLARVAVDGLGERPLVAGGDLVDRQACRVEGHAVLRGWSWAVSSARPTT